MSTACTKCLQHEYDVYTLCTMSTAHAQCLQPVQNIYNMCTMSPHCAQCLQHLHNVCNMYTLTPPPVPARKTQRSGATFGRAVFSAKEVPSAQDLRPRAQTHLPFGCSVVGVMWKPKAALNLQKNISSLGLYMIPDQWYVRTCHWSSGICTGLQVGKRQFKPADHPPEFFALFVTWL